MECWRSGLTHQSLKMSYHTNWYRNERNRLIDSLGSCCVKCGETDKLKLEFHHKDTPTRKKFNIGNLLSHSRASVQEELRKCQLLCLTCHRGKKEVHGNLTGYRRGCRCLLCSNANHEYYLTRKRLKTGEGVSLP